MKILLLTGDHPRHLYLADTFSKTDLDIKWVIEKREPLIPVAKNISKTIKKLYEFHFHKRAEVEKNFFYESGELAKKKLKLVHEIKKAKEINSELKKICDKFQPDLLIAYGSGIINDQILDRISFLVSSTLMDNDFSRKGIAGSTPRSEEDILRSNKRAYMDLRVLMMRLESALYGPKDYLTKEQK